MNTRFARLDKMSAETEQIRADTERLAARNAATLRQIKEELNALRR